MIINNRIFRQDAYFVGCINSDHHAPKLNLPQIAFIGKSNVGKSTLINKLCNNKSIARVSNSPGRTRQINFFSLGNKLLLVDLPGYGFAKVPLYMKKKWEKYIIKYLSYNEYLKIVNILIDIRRGIKENDMVMINILESLRVSYQIVFTKLDKVKPYQADTIIKNSHTILSAFVYMENIIITSSQNGEGVEVLQNSCIKCCNR